MVDTVDGGEEHPGVILSSSTADGGVNRQLTNLAFLYQIKLCIKVGCLDVQLGEQPI